MDPQPAAVHISQIATNWALIFQAHNGSDGESQGARHELVVRYCGAVYRYLLTAVSEPEIADELCQEFALRFVRGDFKRANPKRGRFRDFVKGVLYHLVADYHRRKHKGPLQVGLESGLLPTTPSASEVADKDFIEHWRGELFDRTWEALADFERSTGHRYHAVLRWRVANPDAAAAQLAAQWTASEGRAFTDFSIRQTLRRAREKFGNLLVDEVARSLMTTDLTLVEQELADLGLADYCKVALRKRLGFA